MGKALQTHERILDHAISLASRDGLDGLSIGSLASDLGLSKSGLFAHFGSKEAMQIQVLQAVVERFTRVVIRPAFAAPRGEPRVRALFEHWLKWDDDPSMPGGCLMVAAGIELDDKPGPARDFLVKAQQDWFRTIAEAVRLAQECGHLKPGLDPEQLAYEMYAMVLGFHHIKRLLHDTRAEARVRAAFDRLIDSARA